MSSGLDRRLAPAGGASTNYWDARAARLREEEHAGKEQRINAKRAERGLPERALSLSYSAFALGFGALPNAIPDGIYAVFFSDAGGGMGGAGIARLADLDRKGVVAGTTSADSAPIGDSRALHRDGILSHVNGAAMRLGGRIGMPLKELVDLLIAPSKRTPRAPAMGGPLVSARLI